MKIVLVQREMESGRSPLVSITPFSAGRFAPANAVAACGAVAEDCNWFQKRDQAAWAHSPQRALSHGL